MRERHSVCVGLISATGPKGSLHGGLNLSLSSNTFLISTHTHMRARTHAHTTHTHTANRQYKHTYAGDTRTHKL